MRIQYDLMPLAFQKEITRPDFQGPNYMHRTALKAGCSAIPHQYTSQEKTIPKLGFMLLEKKTLSGMLPDVSRVVNKGSHPPYIMPDIQMQKY